MATRRLFINGRWQTDPRSSWAWQQLRKRVIAEEPICWLQLEGCTQASTTGDHVIPVTERPDLALVRSNVHGACRPCNDQRGRMPITAIRLGSEDQDPPPALSVFD